VVVDMRSEGWAKILDANSTEDVGRISGRDDITSFRLSSLVNWTECTDL